MKCDLVLNKGRCEGKLKIKEILDGGKVYRCEKCGATITTNVELEKIEEKDILTF